MPATCATSPVRSARPGARSGPMICKRRPTRHFTGLTFCSAKSSTMNQKWRTKMTLERKDGDWLLTLTWTGNDIRTILEHHGLELEDSQIMEIMEFLDKMSSLGVSTERIE